MLKKANQEKFRVFSVILSACMLLSAVFVPISASAEQEKEFITNGSFDNALSGYTYYTADGEQGTKCVVNKESDNNYLYIPKTIGMSGDEDYKANAKFTRLYQKVTGLETGKNYSLTFDLKLSNASGNLDSTSWLGFAGVSTAELTADSNAHYGVKNPSVSAAYCRSFDGTFDKWDLGGVLIYNGSENWLGYEMDFTAESDTAYVYFENFYGLVDFSVDNVSLKESTADGDTINIDVPAKEQTTKNVLLIGNSYGYDTVRELQNGIISSGSSDLRIGLLSSGGKEPSFFYDQVTTGAKSMSFSYYSKTNGKAGAGKPVSFDMVNGFADWDYIAIQAGTTHTWNPSYNTETLNKLIKAIESKNSSAEIVIYGTWATTDAYASSALSNMYTNQSGMHSKIMQAYNDIKSATGKRLLDTESIFYNLRANSLFGDTLNRDGYHLNGKGAVTVGLAFYEFFTGTDVTTLNYNTTSFVDNNVTSYNADITSAQLSAIKTAVHTQINGTNQEEPIEFNPFGGNGNFEIGDLTGFDISKGDIKVVTKNQNEGDNVAINGKAAYIPAVLGAALQAKVTVPAGKYVWSFDIYSNASGWNPVFGITTALNGDGYAYGSGKQIPVSYVKDVKAEKPIKSTGGNGYFFDVGIQKCDSHIEMAFELETTQELYFFIHSNGNYAYIDNMEIRNQNVIAKDDFETYAASGEYKIAEGMGVDGTKALNISKAWGTANDYSRTVLYKYENAKVASSLISGSEYIMRFKYKVTSMTTATINIAPQPGNKNVLLRAISSDRNSVSHIEIKTKSDEWSDGYLRFSSLQAWGDTDFGGNSIAIAVGGQGNVFIDDVEVIRLDKVTYNSNGGSDVSDVTYGETGTDIVFPVAPTRDGYTFTGWYVDAECTTKAVKYNGDAVLYAGWKYSENIIADDDFSNYARNESNTADIFSEEEVSGNKALKMVSTETLNSGAWRAAPLYKTEMSKKAAVVQGDAYVMRFRYKVDAITSTDNSLIIGPVTAQNTWKVNLLSATAQSNAHACVSVSSATDGWQNAELRFFGVNAWNTDKGVLKYTDLWIGVGGSGTVYIDDVEVIRLDKITYDVMGGEELQPTYGEYGTPVTYSYTTKANYVFTGWYKDGTFTEKAADVFGGDTTVYAGWKNVIQGGKHSFSYGADIGGSFITEDGKELEYTNDPAAVSVDTNGNVTIKNNGAEAAEYTFLLNDYNGLYASLAKNSYAVKYGYKASAGTSFAFVTGMGENFVSKCTKNIEVKENMSSNALSELHFTGIGKTTEEGVVYYPYLGIRATIPAGGELVLSGITVKNTYIVKVETWGGEYSGDTTFSVDQGDDFNIGWLTTPTLDGYKFMGWYTNAGYEHITGTITVTADTTIYADWLPIGLEADVNGDGKLDILDLVRAKKVFADENAYSEYDIDRAYYLGKDKGDAANLSGIRKLLLGIADSANTANDIRIAGVSIIGKFAFEMPKSTEGSILSEGISAFKESLSAFNISETAASGQPVIKAELTESDAPTSSYTFTVTKDGITVSADNAEALIGGLNRLAHMLNLASETKTQLHLNVGYTCPFEFAPLDGEYAISFIDTFSSFDRSVWVDAENPYYGSTKYINSDGKEADARKYTLNTIKAETNNTGSLVLPAGKITDKYGDTGFYSSGISTKDTMNYKYGVLEIRAKIGATPLTSSIWLKGVEKNSKTGHFPEVDVFETNWQSNDGVDNDKKLGFNVHWWDTATVSGNIGAQWSDTKTKFSDDFHTYTFVWTPEAYTVYVDGVKYGYYSITYGKLGEEEAETFRQPMFLILGTGIAGVNYGPVYDESKYSEPFSDYEIDYVKISQRALDGGLMNITRKSDIEVKRTTEQHEKLLKDFGLTIY